MPKLKGKGVVFNSFIISFQRLFAAIIGVFITPVILNELGIDDYGLYTLIVGFVGALTFINWSLSMTTQRYVSYALGEGNVENQNKAFSNSMSIHVIYSVVIFILILSIGFLGIDSFLKIPENRLHTAKILLILVAGITCFSIVSTPYLGVIKAHENFLLYSGLGIFASVIKIFIVIIIKYADNSTDKLLLYTTLLLASSLIVFLFNWYITSRLYKESKYSLKHFDISVIKEMMGFMGWNLFGALAIMGRNQGVSVLLNIFFGVVKNAAYGIASQINVALSMVSQGVTGALTPRILKNAGGKEEDKMIYNVVLMTKLSIISSAYFIIFFLMETNFILKTWLGKIPENAADFSRLILVFSLTTALSGGLQIVFNAIGKVKEYSIYISVILILNLPIGYVFFKLGYSANSILVTSIILELIALFARVFLMKKYLNFNFLDFINQIFFKTLIPVITTLVFAYLIPFTNIGNEYFRVAISFFYVLLFYSILVYFISLNGNEQKAVLKIIKK